MPFQMGFSQEAVEGLKPIPPGIYTVVFAGFKPAKSKGGDSINFNAAGKITGHPEYDGRLIFTSLNTKIPSFIRDFVHSFGLEMDGEGTENLNIPGFFDAEAGAFKEEDPTTWKYTGPLNGQTAQWEISIKPHYQDANKISQDIVKYICAVPDCETRFTASKHSTDMRKK
jgi:hypothetical protein